MGLAVALSLVLGSGSGASVLDFRKSIKRSVWGICYLVESVRSERGWDSNLSRHASLWSHGAVGSVEVGGSRLSGVVSLITAWEVVGRGSLNHSVKLLLCSNQNNDSLLVLLRTVVLRILRRPDAWHGACGLDRATSCRLEPEYSRIKSPLFFLKRKFTLNASISESSSARMS